MQKNSSSPFDVDAVKNDAKEAVKVRIERKL